MKTNAFISIVWAICSVINLATGNYHVAFLEAFISFIFFDKYFISKKDVK